MSELRIFIVSLFIVTVITVGILYVANEHKKEVQLREAQKLEAVTAIIEMQCAAAYPLSTANQLHCIKEGLEQSNSLKK